MSFGVYGMNPTSGAEILDRGSHQREEFGPGFRADVHLPLYQTMNMMCGSWPNTSVSMKYCFERLCPRLGRPSSYRRGAEKAPVGNGSTVQYTMRYCLQSLSPRLGRPSLYK